MIIVFIVANSTSFAWASDLFAGPSGRVHHRQGRWRPSMNAASVSRFVDEGLAAAYGATNAIAAAASAGTWLAGRYQNLRT
jgi:hypothetical protein